MQLNHLIKTLLTFFKFFIFFSARFFHLIPMTNKIKEKSFELFILLPSNIIGSMNFFFPIYFIWIRIEKKKIASFILFLMIRIELNKMSEWKLPFECIQWMSQVFLNQMANIERWQFLPSIDYAVKTGARNHLVRLSLTLDDRRPMKIIHNIKRIQIMRLYYFFLSSFFYSFVPFL